MTQIHPIINLELQYIRNMDEYILKLQIQQHSLLTRKVFSRHNLLAQLFFYVLSRSSSSPHHIHLQVIFIQIWIIITGSESSLDLDHLFQINITRSGSSLDLDHHCWIIVIRSGSSLGQHHWCYLMILLIIGSSTEPTLFHAGCRPSLHVGLLLALIFDPKSEWPSQHLYLIMQEPIL